MKACLKMDGTENAYVMHKELGEWMTNNMTVVRYNNKLEETIDKIKELKERYKNINMKIRLVGTTKALRSPVNCGTCSSLPSDDTWCIAA